MSTSFNTNLQKPASQEKGLVPEALKLVLLVILLLAVIYLFYDSSQIKKDQQTQINKITDQLQTLETSQKTGGAALTSQITSLQKDLAGAQESVGSTQAELKRAAAQSQAAVQNAKKELSQALASKADTSQVEAQVQAAKSEAETKIGQVSNDVGGVKTQVTAVKTDLDATRRDLEGTQRQLIDVRDTLNAAVAKNTSELAQLRLKGEKDYFEFTLPKKNEQVKVEDIRLTLAKTDAKKGKFTVKVAVDDSSLEKKDRHINEPIQFLVGQNRVRYEVVINWVQKDKAGGYLAIPKDKNLSAERATK